VANHNHHPGVIPPSPQRACRSYLPRRSSTWGVGPLADIYIYNGIDTANHFDHYNLDGGAEQINNNLSATLEVLNPYTGPPDMTEAIYRWGYVLHAAQDFYAHANWIEMGFVDPTAPSDVYDSGLGLWTPRSSGWQVIRPGTNGIVASQEASSTPPDTTVVHDAKDHP